MTSSKISWVLFDLGGVLVEIGGVVETIRQGRGGNSEEDPWEAWLRSPAVFNWETGRTSNEEFARDIIAELQLDRSPEAFLRDCSTWVLGLFPGTEEMLTDLRERVKLACLSNTNGLHWPIIQRNFELDEKLDRCFLSYQIGRGKPEESTFLFVADQLQCRPDEVLFIDDNRLNVMGARAAGMQAEQAFGGEEVRKVLQRKGLL
jgi:HAD superfamily hydrolase (TIGR01509 family)